MAFFTYLFLFYASAFWGALMNSFCTENEISEQWKLIKEAHKNRKKELFPLRVQRIINSNVAYEKFTDQHYRIKGYIDFWPSTGYFKSIKNKRLTKEDLELMMRIKNG
jgi:hypothetical protein